MQANYGNYNPASFGWGGANDPELHPDLLVPFRFAGANFGSMHRDVVGLFTNLLSDLVPLIPGGIATISDEGCFNPKSVTVGGDRSFHTYGIAIDINWRANPMGAPSRPTGPGALPAVTGSIARNWGCEWGGDWVFPKDWMHIECHLSPNVAASIKAESELDMSTEGDQIRKDIADLKEYVHDIFSLPDGRDPKIKHQFSLFTLVDAAVHGIPDWVKKITHSK